MRCSPIPPSMPVAFWLRAECICLQELWTKPSVSRMRYWIYPVAVSWAGLKVSKVFWILWLENVSIMYHCWVISRDACRPKSVILFQPIVNLPRFFILVLKIDIYMIKLSQQHDLMLTIKSLVYMRFRSVQSKCCCIYGASVWAWQSLNSWIQPGYFGPENNFWG